MFPDPRGLPRDPRTASNRNPSRPLGETRNFLTQAASLLTPSNRAPAGLPAAAPSAPGSQRLSWSGPSTQWSCNPTVRSSSVHCERLNIFRPNAQSSRQRSRSVSMPRKSGSTRKRKLWERTFCCLASKTQRSPPGPLDRGRLMQAGLGEKSLTFDEFADAEDIHVDLLEAFPKLHMGGGYEFLRTSDRNTHTLDVIPPPSSGYTVAYLKSVIGQAKVYVRPLQKDLDLSPTQGEDTGFCPTEVCQSCGSSIPLSQLRHHITGCNPQEPQADESTSTPPSSPPSPPYSPFTPDKNASECPTSNSSRKNKHRVSRRIEQSHPPLSDDDDFLFPATSVGLTNTENANEGGVSRSVNVQSDLNMTEEVMVTHALRESAHDNSPEIIDLSTNDFSPESLKDIIIHLQKKLWLETHEYHVRRSDVFQDLMRETRKRSYSPFKRVKTYFVGELGKDTGGLTRELWSIFSNSIQHSLCEGKENCLILRHDATKLQEGIYRKVGMLMGVSIVQGSSAYPYFAPSTFSYLSGMDVCSIMATQDEIPDPEVQQSLQKITSVGDDDAQLQDVVLSEYDMLLSCGFTKPIASLTHVDIPSIIECVTLHTTILKVKAELDDIVKGLDDAGVLEMLRKYPDLFRPLFVYTQDNLTADKLMRLFEKRVFSANGSSELIKEQATYIFFSDFLEEMEGGIEQEEGENVTLHDCLSFFTGTRRIPSTGFDVGCTLNFSTDNVFPTASTCSLTLTLPTLYHDRYSTFKEKMLYAFLNHGGFGLY